MSSVNRYVDKACETNRCLNEAEDVYYAGHVVECLVAAIFGSQLTFLAFVLQTTAIAAASHEVEINICMSQMDQDSSLCKARYAPSRGHAESATRPTFLRRYKIVTGERLACGTHTASNGPRDSGYSWLCQVASLDTSLTCDLYSQLSRAK